MIRKVCTSLTVLMLGLFMSSCGSTKVSSDESFVSHINQIDEAKFQVEHPGRFLDLSTEPGMESIQVANYDPLKKPPTEQRTSGYGRFASEKVPAGKKFYFIAVNSGEKRFLLEMDGETKKVVNQDGEWFLTADRDKYVAKEIEILTSLAG